MQNFKIFALFCSIALFVCSCDRDPPPQECNGTCPTGFECINDKCDCPEGKFRFNQSCRELAEGTLVGVNPACFCYDTLLLTITGEGANRSAGIAFRSGTSIGSASTWAEYFEIPGGDSIHITELPVPCDVGNSVNLKPEGFGRYQPDGTLHLKLVFGPGTQWESTCNVVLDKF